MSASVWKFELALVDVQRVEMPKGARLLHVDTQGAAPMPMLWALVDPAAPKVARLIAVVGTGNPAPDEGEAVYVGTAMMPPFVWHVFDGGEVP